MIKAEPCVARRWAVLSATALLSASFALLLSVALSPVLWPADMVVILAGPVWIVGGALFALLAFASGARRRSRILVVAGVAAGLSAMVMMWVGWSGRRLMPHRVDADEPGLIRVLQVNCNARANPTIERSLAAIASSGADVVVITEFPSEAWRMLQEPSDLSRAYPNFTYRDWVEDKVPGCLVLSRWPVERLEVEFGDDHEQVFVGRVRSPDGDFIVSQIAPQSPRTSRRWQRGNAIVDAATEVLEPLAEREPVVLACDLNSSPFGHRGRVLRRAGFAPGKPAWASGGTWPARSPSVAQVGLDDVWVNGGAVVLAWRSVAIPGSDHLGAEARIRLEDQRVAD